jgi:hypothetical protein
MASISYRLTNLMTSPVLTLRNESWSRKLPSGANWSRIRFGFLGTLGDVNSRAANTGDFSPTFGVASSFPSPGGSYGCPNMAGVCLNGDPTPGLSSILTYAAGNLATPTFNSWTGVAPKSFSRQFDPQIGPVWTVSGAAATAPAFVPDQSSVVSNIGSPKRNNIYIIDIFRGVGSGGTAQITYYYQAAAQANNGLYFTEADLMDALNTQATPIVQSITLTSSAAALNLGISENTGPLDSLFISHDHTELPLNIEAIAAVVILDEIWPLVGGAADNFANYGTQQFPAFTTSGSMGLGDWYGTAASSWTIYGTGWTGTNMTAQNLAGTTIGVPYDPFTQYLVNDSVVTTLSGGTGWSSAALFTGTDQNDAAQSGLAGTTVQSPFDLLVQYIVTGGTFTGGSLLSAGTGWDAPTTGTITGTAAPDNRESGLVGTSTLVPFDLMVQYIVTGGTFTGGSFLTLGTGWDAPTTGTITGTDAPVLPQSGLTGTSSGSPYDYMAQYFVGAVTSGVTISKGTGWNGAGVIH